MNHLPTEALLSAADRDRLARLQLYARQVVEGIAGGMHRSPHKGFSVEFKEHRPYVRGDEVRSIDWKLYGKTDRLYIRQYEEETNLRCTILLDQSGSMSYGTKGPLKVSKHDFAVRLAACLAYMLVGSKTRSDWSPSIPNRRSSFLRAADPATCAACWTTLVQSKPAG